MQIIFLQQSVVLKAKQKLNVTLKYIYWRVVEYVWKTQNVIEVEERIFLNVLKLFIMLRFIEIPCSKKRHSHRLFKALVCRNN